MEKPESVLMECMTCGNVNRSDEKDCVFHCGGLRVNIEHSSYNGQHKYKISKIILTEREKECLKIGVEETIKFFREKDEK